MLKAKDFKEYAKEALAGRWLKSGIVGMVAGILGASIGVAGMSTSSVSSGTEGSEWLESATGNHILPSNVSNMPEIPAMLIAIVLGIALIVLLWAIVVMIIGGATTLGYAKYNLNLVDDNEPAMRDLFSQYHRLGAGFGMQFFRNLYVTLWSFLFVIPGMIANYSYYMTPFILCENPEMTARQAIRESKRLMQGNKWRLFCLQFSFFGWYVLSAVVLVVAVLVAAVPMFALDLTVLDASIGGGAAIILFMILIVYLIVLTLTLSPYVVAAETVFYREICRERYANNDWNQQAADYVYESVPEKKDYDSIEW